MQSHRESQQNINSLNQEGPANRTNNCNSMTTTKTTRVARSFDKQFWFLSFALLIVWAIVITTAAPTTDEQELKNARNCKALCGHCGGLGFYCGEECICECNDDSSDTECIATMQSNARKLNIPFEILIQGPSNNRFVRNAFQFEQNAERKSIVPPARNKRSTVVIYKPTVQNSLYGQCEKKMVDSSSKAAKKSIKKRSVDQLEWFSDLANTLVRPAPLRPQRKAEQVASAAEDLVQHKRSTPQLDRSWFSDNTNLLLKPAPLFKRQSEDSENSYDSPMEKLPQVLRDTISSIKATAISDDFGEALRSKIREGSEAFQSQLQDSNFNLFSEPLRDSWHETWRNMRPQMMNNQVFVPTMETPTPVPPPEMPKVTIPWFRPMQFLQRVQQAIN